MGNFSVQVIGSSFVPRIGRRKVDEVDSDKYRFLHLAVDSCGSFADSADASLRSGDRAHAASAFRYAEEAFSEAQEYLTAIEREDWRDEVESMLEELAVRLDRLWVSLMTVNPSRS
jgi:hypothetical protein